MGRMCPTGCRCPRNWTRREDRLARIAGGQGGDRGAGARPRLERERAEYDGEARGFSRGEGREDGPQAGRPSTRAAGGRARSRRTRFNLTDADFATSCRWPAAASNKPTSAHSPGGRPTALLVGHQRPWSSAPNDKRQIEPALEALARLPEALGAPETLLADSGYFSEANVNACAEAEIAPVDHARPGTTIISPGRTASPARRRPRRTRRRWKRSHTSTGDARGPGMLYALHASANAGTGVRHHQIEPWASASSRYAAWTRSRANGTLVTLAWNIKRMFTLQYA